ncbi:CHAT domain-containing protein [Streptomyces sp. RLB3-17]|nr:CHAT domain-containing protein [Streptomyces sp. S1D4-20]QDN65648.1 CHAT domain-containing protein [Streptomyces sp. S1D4-14]QDN96292.1 CHAT domain-containing protein [Streptomyces sp. RLB1-9]QDO18001.1 CHAT domain-containing protein [Streptomyces sp. S1A1-8]QDO28128.1 CHAT domain-containing protein [Streptomyces sp. S1A1-3]QDO38016.1 CHAT domain-containing protein [Streptomyces sp. RLB3-17]QDO48053.1 CHAT domain-containing protein [Streptomyces sp. RLB3-5]QDO58294.1 CHAT domain-containin
MVGTLWPVDDKLSVAVAELFCQGLDPGNGTAAGATRSAQALHQTVWHVRDTLNYVRAPSLWAPYIGA